MEEDSKYKKSRAWDDDQVAKKRQPKVEDYEQFEDIIDDLGSFGHWQIVIFFLISAADVFGGMAMLLPVFIGAKPRWRCAQFEGMNETFFDPTDPNANATFVKTCELNGTTCIQYQFIDDFTSIISQWNMVCDLDYLSDLLSSTQMAGVFLGAAIFGQLSDTFGRKRMYYLAFFLEIGPGLLSSVSVSWQMYAACRFFVGAGFGAYMVVNCVYPLEFVGRQWRLFCGTIGFWAVGIMILAGLGHQIREWRHLTAVTTAVGFVYYITWIWIPESPRWLVQKRRFDEAQKILDIIAAKNKRPPTPKEVLVKFADADEKARGVVKRYTYLDLFRRVKYIKITLIMALAWFTSFLAYYEISYNLKNFTGNRYLNMFLGGFVDLASMLSVVLVLNRFGRKKCMIGYLVIDLMALVSIVIIVGLGKEKEQAQAILGLALVGKAMALAGTYVVQILSAELFPTVIRNVGLGSGAIAGRTGGLLAPALVYFGTKHTIGPYIICGVLVILAILPITQLPETNGQPLEDTYDKQTLIKNEDKEEEEEASHPEKKVAPDDMDNVIRITKF